MEAFTLIEVLVTMAIVAIVFAFVLPNSQSQLIQRRDKLMRLYLQRSLEAAQLLAIKKQQPVAVCGARKGEACIADWSKGQIIFADIGHEQLPVIRESQWLRFFPINHAHGNLFMRSYPKLRQYIRFESNGWSDNAAFWHCNDVGEVVWVLTLSRFGEISSLLPNKKGVYKDGRGERIICS